MKRLLLSALTGVLLFSGTPAFAGGKVAFVGCPAYIGNKSTKQFMSTSGLVCANSPLKTGGMKSGEVVVSGRHSFMTEFDWTGQGESNSPAFQVGKLPATIAYTYNDANNRGSLKINLIDITTHKVVETLVNAHGTVESSTLVQRQGAFYLHIEGSSDIKTVDDSPADWEVMLSFDDPNAF